MSRQTILGRSPDHSNESVRQVIVFPINFGGLNLHHILGDILCLKLQKLCNEGGMRMSLLNRVIKQNQPLVVHQILEILEHLRGHPRRVVHRFQLRQPLLRQSLLHWNANPLVEYTIGDVEPSRDLLYPTGNVIEVKSILVEVCPLSCPDSIPVIQNSLPVWIVVSNSKSAVVSNKGDVKSHKVGRSRW